MKIIAAALAALAMLASQAQAQMRSRDTSPRYLYLYGEYDYYTDSGAARGGGGGLGWTISPYLGLQAGAQSLSSSVANVANTGADIGADATLLYGEAKLSWPLANSLSVYASAGLAYADATSSITTPYYPRSTYTASKSATGYRVGLGADYWFSRHWGLRASWHQHNAGGVGSDLAAGIAFRF
jgi:opacity protein-like surface antigen